MGFISEYHNKYQTGGLQHLLAAQVRQEVGAETFGSYFKFAFVRNPWDRAVSQYEYTRTRPDLQAFIGMSEDDSFNRYLGLIAKCPHVQWLPQHRFVFDEDGNLLVDFIGSFERLRADAESVFRRLAIRTSGGLPHVNASKRGPIEAYYDREAIEMVAALYKDDLRMFTFPWRAPGLAIGTQNA